MAREVDAFVWRSAPHVPLTVAGPRRTLTGFLYCVPPALLNCSRKVREADRRSKSNWSKGPMSKGRWTEVGGPCPMSDIGRRATNACAWWVVLLRDVRSR